MASLRGDYNVVRLLLETGADVDGKGDLNFADNKYWSLVVIMILVVISNITGSVFCSVIYSVTGNVIGSDSGIFISNVIGSDSGRYSSW